MHLHGHVDSQLFPQCLRPHREFYLPADLFYGPRVLSGSRGNLDSDGNGHSPSQVFAKQNTSSTPYKALRARTCLLELIIAFSRIGRRAGSVLLPCTFRSFWLYFGRVDRFEGLWSATGCTGSFQDGGLCRFLTAVYSQFSGFRLDASDYFPCH